MTFAEIVNKANADLRFNVDESDLVIWGDQIQKDVFTMDIRIFERRTLFTTTIGELDYLLSLIYTAGKHRVTKQVTAKVENATEFYNDGFFNKTQTSGFRFVNLDFYEDDTNIYLKDDPRGLEWTFIDYRTPADLTNKDDTPELPERWIYVLYQGIMKFAAEHQYKTPSGDWHAIYEAKKNQIKSTEQIVNRGPSRVDSYRVITE